MADSDTQIEVQIIGDVGCGKQTLLNQLIWPDQPVWSSQAITSQFLCGRTMNLSIRNTGGSRKNIHLEEKTDVIVLCFSIDHPDSFRNIELKWMPTVSKHFPNAQLLLVGNKEDLRTVVCPIRQQNSRNTACKFVTTAEGQEMAERLGAYRYVECSASEDTGVDDVLMLIAWAHFRIQIYPV